jgi:arsenate reductase
MITGEFMEKKTVLFVCSFNSVRSQIAEGLLRHRCGGRYTICSAGLAPAGLNPYAVLVMKEAGIDISRQRSKSVSRFSQRKFDYVITLCDQVSRAGSSIIPKGDKVCHRGFTSPSEIRKNKDEITADYRRLRDDIGAWISEIFPDCPSGTPVTSPPGCTDPAGQGNSPEKPVVYPDPTPILSVR